MVIEGKNERYIVHSCHVLELSMDTSGLLQAFIVHNSPTRDLVVKPSTIPIGP